MKNILSLLLLICLLFLNLQNSFADQNIVCKEEIVKNTEIQNPLIFTIENNKYYSFQKFKSKIILEKSEKLKNRISGIDYLVLDISDEKLIWLFYKIGEAKHKNDLVKYLEAKIYLKLAK